MNAMHKGRVSSYEIHEAVEKTATLLATLVAAERMKQLAPELTTVCQMHHLKLGPTPSEKTLLDPNSAEMLNLWLQGFASLHREIMPGARLAAGLRVADGYGHELAGDADAFFDEDAVSSRRYPDDVIEYAQNSWSGSFSELNPRRGYRALELVTQSMIQISRSKLNGAGLDALQEQLLGIAGTVTPIYYQLQTTGGLFKAGGLAGVGRLDVLSDKIFGGIKVVAGPFIPRLSGQISANDLAAHKDVATMVDALPKEKLMAYVDEVGWVGQARRDQISAQSTYGYNLMDPRLVSRHIKGLTPMLHQKLQRAETGIDVLWRARDHLEKNGASPADLEQMRVAISAAGSVDTKIPAIVTEWLQSERSRIMGAEAAQFERREAVIQEEMEALAEHQRENDPEPG